MIKIITTLLFFFAISLQAVATPVAEAAVEEVTMDSVAEVTVDADTEAPVKKSRKKKE